MGKKRVSFLGDTISEEEVRQKRQIQKEQKALREGKKNAKDDRTQTHHDTPTRGIPTGTAPGVSPDQQDTIPTSPTPYTDPTSTLETPTATKTQKRTRSNRYINAKKQLNVGKIYPITDAIKLIRKLNLTKFPATLELHINLIKNEGSVNQIIDLPHGTGKTKKVALVDDKILQQLDKNQIEFDVLVASPSQMPQLVKYAKFLGPKGLMPNPKNGTVVTNPAEAIEKLSAATRLEVKSEKKAPLIHTTAGKMNMEDIQLVANTQAIINSVGTQNIQRVYLKSTMSPTVRIEVV